MGRRSPLPPPPPPRPAHTCEAFQSSPSASVAPAGGPGGAATPKRARQTAREIRGERSGPGRRTLPRPLHAPAGDCTSRQRYFIFYSSLKFSLLLSLSRGRTGVVALRAGALPGRLPWACEVGREGGRDASAERESRACPRLRLPDNFPGCGERAARAEAAQRQPEGEELQAGRGKAAFGEGWRAGRVAGASPPQPPRPLPCPGRLRGPAGHPGGHRGSLGGGCAPRREQHLTRVPAGRPPAAPGGKAAAGRSRASCLPASGLPLRWLRRRALARPWGFSGSLGPLRCTEAAGKGLVSVLGDGGRVP